MGIRLHEIVITPGASLSFRQELAMDRLNFPSVVEYLQPPVGEGVIRNEAEAVTLYGEIRCRMRCVCDLCTAEFECDKIVPLSVPIAVNEQDEDNPDYFPLEGEELDITELLETCFILEMDSRFLCQEDCKGLCPRCGVNLNHGSCNCKPDTDPRLAVLEQLLDDKH